MYYKYRSENIQGPSSVGCGDLWVFSYSGSVSGETSRRWEVSDHFEIASQTSTEITLNPTNSGDGYVTYVASNSCGETVHCKSVYVSGFSTCGPGIISSPDAYSCGPEGAQNFAMTSSNPNEDRVITIEALGSIEALDALPQEEEPTVQLYDFSNNRVHSQKMWKGKLDIQTRHLKQGMYVLVVRHKKEIIWRTRVVLD